MKLGSMRPTPAFVIATGALVVALGGTSYAAAKISGRDIKKHSIAGNRMKANTLTGKQIKESKLGTVPKAAFVNGATLLPFHFMVATGGVTQTVMIPGGSISANCVSNQTNLDLTGNLPDPSGATLQVSGYDTGSVHQFTSGDDNVTTNSSDGLSPDNSANGVGTAVLARPSGGVTTITFSYEVIEGGCIYSGTAVGTP
jgi:hypothetical protein